MFPCADDASGLGAGAREPSARTCIICAQCQPAAIVPTQHNQPASLSRPACLQLLLNKDGTLRESWSDLEFSATLMQLDGGWNLFYLGEAADYLLGPNASRRWEHEEPPAELDEFKAVMQVTDGIKYNVTRTRS